MQVTRITSLTDLEALAPHWNRLAGEVPFRTCEWMHSWWRSYGSDVEGHALYVLVVRDAEGQIVAVAPWYTTQSTLKGRVVRFLGSGEVCSDYLSLLVEPQNTDDVAKAIANWCHEQTATRSADRFSSIELDGVLEHDEPMDRLAREMRQRGFRVRRRGGPNFWRLDLPDSWDDYLAMLSKSHRKQLRKLDRRVLQSNRARIHAVDGTADLDRWWPVFKQLHQRRRESRNERGCFASHAFERFLNEAAPELLQQNLLRLDILELDGQPVAAEYDLVMGDVVYAYQSGLEPSRIADEPGRVLQLAVIQRAIREGRQAIDFLRGDEPYKAHWRATPRPSTEITIAPVSVASAVRGTVSSATSGVKQWIKNGMQAAGLH